LDSCNVRTEYLSPRLTWVYGQPPLTSYAPLLLGGKALNYRLYCFDGMGKVWAADWLSASSDAEAIEIAHCMDVCVKCEIWQGKRLVGTIDREKPASLRRR
jgi:hypothetical protein